MKGLIYFKLLLLLLFKEVIMVEKIGFSWYIWKKLGVDGNHVKNDNLHKLLLIYYSILIR